MASVDFADYARQDLDTPYYVGRGKNRFGFGQLWPREKLQIRRWEVYPFGKSDFISGMYLVTGDLVVDLPAATKRTVTIDYVSYSGGADEGLKVRGFDAEGKYIGYCVLPKRADASVRRASLELPGVKLLYIDQKREYLLVSINVDQTPSRKLVDVREISDLAPYLTPQGRLSVSSLSGRSRRPNAFVKR